MNDVLEFHELTDEAKKALKMQEKSQRRGAAGVAYGKPAHLLDAARYITEAWNAISQQTIKNAFIKADLKIWSQNKEEPSNDIVDIRELISRFSNVKISLTSEDIENNIQLDHEDNSEYQAAMGEEVDKILKEQEMQKSESSVDQPSTSSQGTTTSQSETVFAANQPTTSAAQSACFDKIF